MSQKHFWNCHSREFAKTSIFTRQKYHSRKFAIFTIVAAEVIFQRIYTGIKIKNSQKIFLAIQAENAILLGRKHCYSREFAKRINFSP